MAQSNLAYQQEAFEYDAQPIEVPRPKLRTIQGKKRKVQAQPASWANTMIVTTAVVVVVLASISIARISISNFTVQMMQNAEQTTLAINQARAVGLELEVQHSLANNPTKIQDRAASLGILPSHQPATVPAQEGFAPEILDQLQLAANEARASELTLLQEARNEAEAQAALAAGVDAEPAADTESGTEAEAGVDDTQDAGDEAYSPESDGA